MARFEDDIERILAGMPRTGRTLRAGGSTPPDSLEDRVALLEGRLASAQDAIRHNAKVVFPCHESASTAVVSRRTRPLCRSGTDQEIQIGEAKYRVVEQAPGSSW
jgi:hypothetical protein